jgi:GT2 family glycosyltransferase
LGYPIKKVSIITVCHNQLAHTKRFIKSLIRYTPQEPIAWELIAVNSGSTDGTKEYLDSLNGTDLKGDNIQFEENIGWIKGINLGLEEVSDDSDIVIFSNNDVVLEKIGWLETLCKHFTESVGAVGPTSNYVMGRQQSENNVPGVTEEETRFLIGFFMAVRKDVIDSLGPLEENLADWMPDADEETKQKLALGGADDLDYSIRMRIAGYRMMIARDVFVWHSGSKTFFDLVGKDGYNNQWRTADQALLNKWGPEELNELYAAPLKLAFGIPLRGWHVHWKFASSLNQMIKPPNWMQIEAPRTVVDHARNLIVLQAQKDNASYILFVDDDQIFPRDLFFRLLGHGKEVVAALAFGRVAPYRPCVYSWETSRENGNLMVRDRPDLIRTGLQKVDAVGMGAMLIRMDVFKRLGPQPWFKFDEVGEDLTFCDKCAQKGIPVHCDTDLILPHITDEGVEITDYHFNEYYKFQQQQKVV